jgi:hypothetical protein
VDVELDVLRALVVDGVPGHVDGRDVVAEHHRGPLNGGVKLAE